MIVLAVHAKIMPFTPLHVYIYLTGDISNDTFYCLNFSLPFFRTAYTSGYFFHQNCMFMIFPSREFSFFCKGEI
jgi:hypothetical protein